MDDWLLLTASLSAASVHGLVNVVEYILVRATTPSPFQMFQGQAPLLSKGPLAHFFGGPSIIEHLSPESPWPGFNLTILASCLIWLIALLTKNIVKIRHSSVLDALHSAIVDNVLNTGIKATALG